MGCVCVCVCVSLRRGERDGIVRGVFQYRLSIGRWWEGRWNGRWNEVRCPYISTLHYGSDQPSTNRFQRSPHAFPSSHHPHDQCTAAAVERHVALEINVAVDSCPSLYVTSYRDHLRLVRSCKCLCYESDTGYRSSVFR